MKHHILNFATLRIVEDNRIRSLHELQWDIETKYPFGDITSFQWHSFCGGTVDIERLFESVYLAAYLSIRSTRSECPVRPASCSFYFYPLCIHVRSLRQEKRSNPRCHVHIFQFPEVNALNDIASTGRSNSTLIN